MPRRPELRLRFAYGARPQRSRQALRSHGTGDRGLGRMLRDECWLLKARSQKPSRYNIPLTNSPQLGGAPRDVANLGLVRPPFVYLASLVLGAVLHLAMPWPVPFLPGGLAVLLGVPLVGVAIALFAFAVGKFRA